MQEPVPALPHGPTKRKRGRPKNEVKRPKTTLLHMWGLAEKAKSVSSERDEHFSGRQDKDTANVDIKDDTETHSTALDNSATPLQDLCEITTPNEPLLDFRAETGLELDVQENSSSNALLLDRTYMRGTQTIFSDSLALEEQTHLLTEEVDTSESRDIPDPISESNYGYINGSENSHDANYLSTSRLEMLMSSSEHSQEVVLDNLKFDLDDSSLSMKVLGNTFKQGRKAKVSAVKLQSLRQYFGLPEQLEPEERDLTEQEEKESSASELDESLEFKIEVPTPLTVEVNSGTSIANSGPKKPIHPFFTKKGTYYLMSGNSSNIKKQPNLRHYLVLILRFHFQLLHRFQSLYPNPLFSFHH